VTRGPRTASWATLWPTVFEAATHLFAGERFLAPPAEFDLIGCGRSHDENVDGHVSVETAPQFGMSFLERGVAQLAGLRFIVGLRPAYRESALDATSSASRRLGEPL
jgi:hypothetical protein